MRVYLDHAATTPLLPEIVTYYADVLSEYPGNASSLHYEGQHSRQLYNWAKQTIADCIHVDYDEIIFTSGGTEADNMALFGCLKAIKNSHPERKKVITSSIEHEAVIESVKALGKMGYEIVFAPVSANGIVEIDYLKQQIDEKTAICSIMFANNEVGTIQPIRQISTLCQKAGCFFHTDAVQAMGKVEQDVNELGVDMLSASAHKFYGPKGVGFLYIKKGTPLEPVFYGGGHEGGLRSGTENVPGVAAMAKALKIVTGKIEEKRMQYQKWTDQILNTCKQIQGVQLNGDPDKRTPGSLSLSFSGINGEALMGMLSMDEIAVSTASACRSHSHSKGGSHVLTAMNCPLEFINGTIRVVLGWDNTDEQIDYFCDKLMEKVTLLRRLSNG
ncbi:MAG TPA: cysteine desulfurase family protein [Thermotogota bacterium]|nr:cysteine desulfurase family protein [Thermotogota bacterium]HRW34709.1 cysteine desulfurase family protein [Thermotogota bacterium]